MDMAEARQNAEWERTSWQMCQRHNLSIDPKKARPKKPDDFNPFAKKNRKKKTKIAKS